MGALGQPRRRPRRRRPRGRAPRITPGRLALAAAALIALALAARRWLRPAVARIMGTPTDTTVTDADGAVRSVQTADLVLPRAELERIWNPEHLERLARTYWRFLTRITLGLIRIEYTETQRTVVLVSAPLRLLRFRAPEYEMDARRAMVRWRIEDGLLVATRGRGGNGYLEIEVERRGPVTDGEVPEPDSQRLRVKVEVASFYPAIASRLSRWVYENTQSRIHVLVTQGFLRSLAALDLAESKVGRLAGVDQVPGTRVAGGGAAGRPASAPELRSGRAAR